MSLEIRLLGASQACGCPDGEECHCDDHDREPPKQQSVFRALAPRRQPDPKYRPPDIYAEALKRRYPNYTPPAAPTPSPIARNDFRAPDPFAGALEARRRQDERKERR